MTEASSPSKAVVSFLFSNVFECAICGARGPREMFDVHHISYDPEITVMLCASCHAIITRNKLSPEAQLQIEWVNENLKLIIKAYMRKIAKLKAQINELEKLKRGLLEPIKEYIVKPAGSLEEIKQLIEQGYEVVGSPDIKFLKKRVPIPWRLKA
ncbi:MAG: HNH endonuclease signature motif containing protein [Candidatus Bathyarchaeia archaeon]